MSFLSLCLCCKQQTESASLPPAKEVCEGNVFTGVCLSTGRGGVSVQGEFLFRGGLCQGDPRTVTCGRYASYWNAFLLSIFSVFRGASPFSEASEESQFKRKSRGPDSPAKQISPIGKRSRDGTPDKDTPKKKVRALNLHQSTPHC